MLKQRVVTALALLAALVLVLFFLPTGYVVAAFALISALAAWEWNRLIAHTLSDNESGRLWFPLWVLFCCGIFWWYPALQLPLCGLALAFWLLTPLWLAKRWPIRNKAIAYAVGTIVIVPAWIGLVRMHGMGPWVLLAAMALVWVADIAAYFVGRAIGRHKLAPAVSPGKTWEGAAGAVAGGLIYVFLLHQYGSLSLPANVVLLLLGTVVFVAISIVGDLFESMIKRQAGVKDSSQLLPGHGGILDRVDSLTSTLPLLVVASSFWKT